MKKTKVRVENLVKIFGPDPDAMWKMMSINGSSAEDIFQDTDHVVAVDDVSFDVFEGETFVIMGLSGSGKSTIVRCINLLTRPTSGNIYVDGDNIVDYDKKQLKDLRQLKIGMVFQQFGLFSHRSVIGNVEWGLEIRGIPKQQRIKTASAALERVGLEGWGDKYPSELSGGMKQRVGLARALANDPDILLMDEPFSALDPLIRRNMHTELLSLQSSIQKTIIFITHDLKEAFKIGDRIAMLKNGKIEQIGTSDEILSSPASEYIEEFIQDYRKE